MATNPIHPLDTFIRRFTRRPVVRGVIASVALGIGTMGRYPIASLLGAFVLLSLAVWPRIWFTLPLGILEEGVHMVTTGVPITLGWVTNHWSSQMFGVNIYPVLTFPFLAIVFEMAYNYPYRKVV